MNTKVYKNRNGYAMYLVMPPLPSFSIPRPMEANRKESDQHFRERIRCKVNKQMEHGFKVKHPRHSGNRQISSSTQSSLISQQNINT
jgi:hypothetical protein